MKQVGKRKPAQGLEAADRIQKLARAIRGDRPFMPRGVFRFRTFEEAQRWAIEMMARKRKSK